MNVHEISTVHFVGGRDVQCAGRNGQSPGFQNSFVLRDGIKHCNAFPRPIPGGDRSFTVGEEKAPTAIFRKWASKEAEKSSR